jgi:hypothetical protein
MSNVKELLKRIFGASGSFRAECAYHHALDDVWDALDLHNPCHDKVREVIQRLRRDLPRV